MAVNRYQLFQLFKYCIYLLIAFNVYLFFRDEITAAELQYAGGIPAGKLIEAFASSIDTAAWLILLLMFELETNVLSDSRFTRPVVWALHGLRFFCYAFIVYAFYGYIVNLEFVSDVQVANQIHDLCAIADGQWSYAVALDQYELIDSVNCAALSSSNDYYRYGDLPLLVDAAGNTEMLRLAWVDVINSAVWLLVVLNLEIDVRLQERGMLDGLILKISNTSKFFIYSALFLAAVYWGFKGDFVDFWDAFLWLVAFVFIEMNVFSWRQEAIRDREADSRIP